MRLLDMIHKNYDEDRGPYMHALNMIQLTTHPYIQVQIIIYQFTNRSSGRVIIRLIILASS